jgi:hypothetical protein
MYGFPNSILKLLIPCFLLFSSVVHAQSKEPLNETGFVGLFLPRSIAVKVQGAQQAQELIGLAGTEEMYSPRLKASGGRFRTNEDPANRFQPSLTPVDEVNVGVQQQLPSGISVEGGVFANQKSAADNAFVDATQIGAKVSLRVDLLKNRSGQMDQAKLQLSRIKNERVATQSKITSKQQEISARKLYWNFIANQESLALAAKLENSAKKQLSEAEARQRLSVADAGEIARYRSQLQSRRASILLFQHERELLWQAVQRQTNGIDPDRYEFNVKAAKLSAPAINECLAKVVNEKAIDPKNTLLDENIANYRQELEKELENLNVHSKADLAFIGSAQTSGVSDSYGRAIERQAEAFKFGNYLGLEFSMPLGDKSSRTEKAMIAAKKLGIEAQADVLESELTSTFRAMEKSLAILQKGLATQKENSSYLSVSYREMRRKFDQGRIPLTMVINEQDALFQSELQEITFQKQIVHTLLDYFAVFSEFPCEWNQGLTDNNTSAVEVEK